MITISGMTHSPNIDRLDTFKITELELDSAGAGVLGGAQKQFEGFAKCDRAVLLFVQSNGMRNEQGEVLLIRKKRGLGAGKINGPGGKLEDGESFANAALRECEEEVGLRAFAPELRGRLYFAFTDGYNIYVEVFWSYTFEGNIRETNEAVPFWCPVQDIPYSEMWADDKIWLPLALQGQNFVGYIVMDGDRIVSLSFRSEDF